MRETQRLSMMMLLKSRQSVSIAQTHLLRVYYIYGRSLGTMCVSLCGYSQNAFRVPGWDMCDRSLDSRFPLLCVRATCLKANAKGLPNERCASQIYDAATLTGMQCFCILSLSVWFQGAQEYRTNRTEPVSNFVIVSESAFSIQFCD